MAEFNLLHIRFIGASLVDGSDSLMMLFLLYLNIDVENYAEFLLSLWCLQPSRIVSPVSFFFLIPSLRFFP